jgi:hypothetical protein
MSDVMRAALDVATAEMPLQLLDECGRLCFAFAGPTSVCREGEYLLTMRRNGFASVLPLSRLAVDFTLV